MRVSIPCGQNSCLFSHWVSICFCDYDYYPMKSRFHRTWFKTGESERTDEVSPMNKMQHAMAVCIIAFERTYLVKFTAFVTTRRDGQWSRCPVLYSLYYLTVIEGRLDISTPTLLCLAKCDFLSPPLNKHTPRNQPNSPGSLKERNCIPFLNV